MSFIDNIYDTHIRCLHNMTSSLVPYTQPERKNLPRPLRSLGTTPQLYSAPPGISPATTTLNLYVYYSLSLLFTTFYVSSNSTLFIFAYVWTLYMQNHTCFHVLVFHCALFLRFIQDDICSRNIY